MKNLDTVKKSLPFSVGFDEFGEILFKARNDDFIGMNTGLMVSHVSNGSNSSIIGNSYDSKAFSEAERGEDTGYRTDISYTDIEEIKKTLIILENNIEKLRKILENNGVTEPNLIADNQAYVEKRPAVDLEKLDAEIALETLSSEGNADSVSSSPVFA